MRKSVVAITGSTWRVFGHAAKRLRQAGVDAYRKGKYKRAHRLLVLWLRARPGDHMARLHLARCERELEQPEQSLKTISQVLATDPCWPPAVQHALELQLKLGREADARQVIDRLDNLSRYSDDDLLSVWEIVSTYAPALLDPLTDKLVTSRPSVAASPAGDDLGSGDADSLLFRFGFICFAAADQPAGDDAWRTIVRSWRRFDHDGFVVYYHPETALRHFSRDGGYAILIGSAFAVPAGQSVESVLTAILDAHTDDHVFGELDRLSGRFALLICKDSRRLAFHDSVGSRSLFYRSTGAFCLSSHAALVAHAFGHRRSDRVRELMTLAEYKSRTVRYLPGDLTVYTDVYALVPNNYYDLTARRPVRYWPRRTRQAATFTDFLAALDEYFAAFAAYLRGRSTPVLGVTGGIDSRAIMAAFAYYGLRMEGVTWMTGELIKRDFPSAVRLRTYADINVHYLKDRMDQGPGVITDVARRNSGNFRAARAVTVGMRREWGRRRAVFVRGYGGEIIRGFYNLEAMARKRSIKGLTAEELLKAYGSSIRKAREGYAYAKIAQAAFDEFMIRANYDERLSRSGFDLSDVFYWEHRMGMWGAAMHNEMDPAMFAMTGYNSRIVYETAFGLEPQERLTKEVLLRVVRRYDEGMADIPYV